VREPVDRPWYDNKDYPFTTILANANPAIRTELDALDKSLFEKWYQTEIYQSSETASWRVFGIWGFGKKIEDHAAHVPETVKVLEQIPGLTTAGFSWFAGGTHLDPHLGFTNDVLRCHLGIIVPGDCAIRVGTITEPWEEGRVFVFDDTYEHEAWNHSTKDRFILLLDFMKNPKKKYPVRLMQREMSKGGMQYSKAPF
jgi:beta-hydroxylase